MTVNVVVWGAIFVLITTSSNAKHPWTSASDPLLLLLTPWQTFSYGVPSTYLVL